MTPLFEICVQKKKMKDIVIQTINLIIYHVYSSFIYFSLHCT